MQNFSVLVASEQHIPYIKDILSAIEAAAKVPGNSIVMRDPTYLATKMREGKAVIALCDDGAFAGFCYLESWQNDLFVANSGMIVKPEFRGHGLASRIKRLIVEESLRMFPNAKVFGITKSPAVIKMSKKLGFKEVQYDQITSDPKFWKGCDTCRHYSELLKKQGSACQCTALLLEESIIP